MTAKQHHSPHPGKLSGRQTPCWPGFVLWVLMAGLPLNLAAQDDADADEEQSSSQHVEESEEAYRRRMELGEAGEPGEVISDRAATGTNGAEGIDALPLESRKHLRDEMRNLIMEQGEWKPEYAGMTYPYNPSAAAQGDPELRRKEEKAWGDLVQEYHKREAAALAGGGERSTGTEAGMPGSQAGGQGGQAGNQAGSQSDNQAGNESGSTAGSSSASQGRRSPRSPDSRPETDDAASSTAAGAGVSQSALEYLRQQQMDSQAGNQAGAQPTAGAAGNTGQQQQNATATASTSSAGQQQSNASSGSSSGQSAPPGSVAIEELRDLESGGSNALAAATKAGTGTSAAAGSPADMASNSVVLSPSSADDKPSQRPGTVAIDELEKLPDMEREAEPPPDKANDQLPQS